MKGGSFMAAIILLACVVWALAIIIVVVGLCWALDKIIEKVLGL